MARSQAATRASTIHIGAFVKTATSPDINCHQGISSDGTFMYGFDSGIIYKFDASWNTVTANTGAATAAGVTHLGDGQYSNGKLYVAAENYVNDSTPATNKKIAVFDAATLNLITTYTVTQMDEIASVCVDSAKGIIYAISYVSGRSIYKYSLANGAYLGSITLSHSLKRAQGLSIYGGYLWVGRGLYNKLYKIGMDGNVLDVRPLFTIGGYELEGIDISTGTLYALYDTGADEMVCTYKLLDSGRDMVRNVSSSLNFNNNTIVNLSQNQNLPAYRSTGYSVCGWILNRPKGSSQVIYGEGNSTTDTQYLLIDVLATNAIRIRINNDANTTLVNTTSDIILPRNRWVPFVWSDNGGDCMLVVDGKTGVANFNYTPAGTLTFNRSAIGALPKLTNTSFFTGKMSNIKLFDRALSYEEALLVMRENLPGTIGNYRLSEGSGTVANDTSGKANNGVITNGSWSTASTPGKARTQATARQAS